jgi:Cys-rich repeat protein
MVEVSIEGASCNDKHPCALGFHCITGECYPPFSNDGCTHHSDCDGTGKPWCLNLDFVSRCVVCFKDKHCYEGQYCHYSTLCDHRCTEDYDCGGGMDFCDEFSGRCVQCVADGDCPDGTTCNVNIGKCIAEISTNNGGDGNGRL